MKKINYLMALCLSALGGFSMAQAQTTVQVRYTYTHDGVEIGERTVEETVGAAPADQASLPPYVTATGYPETIGENDNNREIPIITTYNENLPFRVSDDTNPVYYRVWFRVNETYVWYASLEDLGEEEGKYSCTGLTVDTQERYKWQIGGDWLNGFTIKTQSGKYLTTPQTVTNSSQTVMTDAPAGDKSLFLLEAYPGTGNPTEWRFRLKENAGFYLAHTSSGTHHLTIYQRYGANNVEYIGARVNFEEMGDFGEMIDALKAERENNTELVSNATTMLGREIIVGVPKATASQRTALRTAVNNINNNTNIENFDQYTVLKNGLATLPTAYSNFMNCTDIVLPENGKAYTIVFRPTYINRPDGTSGRYNYLDFDPSINGSCKFKVTYMPDGENGSIAESGVFVVRSWVENGTTMYALVPAYGNLYGYYLTYNNNTTTFGPTNKFVINTMISVKNSQYITDKSLENLFGLACIQFPNSSNAALTAHQQGNGYFAIRPFTPFLGTASSNPALIAETNLYTSALIMKEVPYPSSVHLNAADGIDDIEGIGTFSAPYNAVVPEGVTAYYVENVDGANGEKWAHTVSLTAGEAVPAGQGVLLTGEAGTDVVMAPAAGETVATVGDNLLGASAGAAKEIPAAENAYILTKKNDVVGFYNLNATDRTLAVNKAYLVMPADAAVQQIKLDFGHGTTGIGAVEPAAGAADNAPVYDLSGRRVAQPVKGGIYFKAGRKFIVK